MLTLYYKPGACSLAVHILLDLVGADYTAVEADPADPGYLQINPASAVPALRLADSSVLTQAGACLAYVSATHLRAGLGGGDDVRAKAELERWADFLTGDLHPAFFPVFRPDRYTTDESLAAREAVKAAGMQLVRRKLALLEARLEARTHLVGDTLTWVDIYAFPMVRWASLMLPGGLGETPNLERHHEALAALPTVRTVLAKEGLTP